MSTVFNPDEARIFADWLEEEVCRMMADLRDTSTRMLELQAGWNDVKYEAYMLVFDSSTEGISRFAEDAHRYIEYLRRKADIVTEYLES